MQEVVEKWLSRDPDPQTRAELSALMESDKMDEVSSRFDGRLAFGTAGLRGILGAGSNRMNRLVVIETTIGLADYLLDTVPDAKTRGVVIGYDGRIGSSDFSAAAADVLSSKGFRVWLGDRPFATPVTAFAVTHFGAAAGIMVTASHNPPEYNGYKVYWGNGAQIIPPEDTGIAACIARVAAAPLPAIERVDELVTLWGDALLDTYFEGVSKLSFLPNRGNRPDFPVAFTPLHGVGAEPSERAFREAGFSDVHTVASQREPDGNFPTVNFPNPEEPGAMDAVIELAKMTGAALAVANDPDADRLAIAARNRDGDYVMLRGDQVGVLLGHALLMHDPNVAVATTIVSSRLLGTMAAAKGATYFETLTGFKWIANGAMDRPDVAFAFGYEEALGYTVGELVRDKDGVSAASIFCELAADLAADGLDVFDRLLTIYQEFGIFMTAQRSLWYEDKNSPLAHLCDRLREAAPESLAGVKVEEWADLRAGSHHHKDGTASQTTLPASDVLTYWLEGGTRVIVRPSGTEPKVKAYYEIQLKVESGEDYFSAWARAQNAIDALVERHQKELSEL